MATVEANLRVFQVHENDHVEWEQGTLLLVGPAANQVTTVTPKEDLTTQMKNLLEQVKAVTTSNNQLKEDLATLTRTHAASNNQLKKEIKALTASNASLTKKESELRKEVANLTRKMDSFVAPINPLHELVVGSGSGSGGAEAGSRRYPARTRP